MLAAEFYGEAGEAVADSFIDNFGQDTSHGNIYELLACCHSVWSEHYNLRSTTIRAIKPTKRELLYLVLQQQAKAASQRSTELHRQLITARSSREAINKQIAQLLASQPIPSGLKQQVTELRKAGLHVAEPQCSQGENSTVTYTAYVTGVLKSDGTVPPAVLDLNRLYEAAGANVDALQAEVKNLDHLASNPDLLKLVIDELPDDATPHLLALQDLISKVVNEQSKGILV